MVNNQAHVAFNVKTQKALYDELVASGLVSESFPSFVRGAFHDRVDSIRRQVRGMA